jgi:hypothetical protein
MADLNPTWQNIGERLAKVITENSGLRTFYPYPDNPVDRLELPCVVVNEPQTINPEGLTFGTYSVRYGGVLTLIVKHIPDVQARLYGQDIAEITNACIAVFSAVHNSRNLDRMAGISNVTLSAGQVGRVSPLADMDAPLDNTLYAGMIITYSILAQYRSSNA